MEQLFSHNQVKTEFAAVLAKLVKSAGLGYYFSDRTLWSNVDAGPKTCAPSPPRPP